MDRIVNFKQTLGYEAIIAQIAQSSGLRTDEAVEPIEHIRYCAQRYDRTRLKFFSTSKTSDREFLQNYSDPINAKNNHFIAFGMRVMFGYELTATPGNFIWEPGIFNEGTTIKTDKSAIKKGRLRISVGDINYYDDMPLSIFSNEGTNTPTPNESFVRFTNPIVWPAEKSIICEIEVPEVIPALIGANDYIRVELKGFELI